MQIQYKKKYSTLIASMYGELDQHVADKIRENIDSKITKAGVKNLVLDFRHLDLMDSSGIGIIIGRYKYVSAKGGKLYIICPNRQIKRVLQISGLLKIISIYDNLEDALKNI